MKIKLYTAFTTLCLLFVALLVLSVSMAQTTNNPNTDENANACFAGGTLAGSCDSTDVDYDGDVDQNDRSWLWKCGWYLIRVEYDIYDSSVLDGICLEIIEEIAVIEEKKNQESSEATEEPEISVTEEPE